MAPNKTPPTNAQIAALLRQTAAVFEIKGSDFFRTRAYQNAASSIENLSIPTYSLWQENKLDKIPGVGPNLIAHLNELFKTGRVKHFQSELKKVPAGMFKLMEIQGIGPKIAYKIASHFKLNSSKYAINKLKMLIKQKKIQKIKGFGPKSEQKISNSLENSLKNKSRLLLNQALTAALNYIAYLQKSKLITFSSPLGSLRRRCATIGDIDIGIASDNIPKAIKYALNYPLIDRHLSSGKSVSRIKLKSGLNVDLKFIHSGQWGSLLQHYTGSKLHNIALRSLAQKKDLSLSEYGILDKKKKLHKFKTERNFYKYLRLKFIPPELREGEEEINLALKNQIPKLIDISDIKGDLHIHSDFKFASSHDTGSSSLFDILKKARKLNYQYVGISDHNPKRTGLTLQQKQNILNKRKSYLFTQYNKFSKIYKDRVPKLLIGLEIDIQSNGDLSLENKFFSGLDYAIASIHSSFQLNKEANTKRILKALQHPKIKILGHPTGRLLNKRNSIQADWQQIFKFCAANNKLLEINASPQRLDLPDSLIKLAIQNNCKLIINSDSHNSKSLSNIKYGVWTARRGFGSKKNIANTRNLETFLQYAKINPL